jgi:hypothetical protein
MPAGYGRAVVGTPPWADGSESFSAFLWRATASGLVADALPMYYALNGFDSLLVDLAGIESGVNRRDRLFYPLIFFSLQ